MHAKLVEFAKEILDAACEIDACDLDIQFVQELGMSMGLVVARKPTEAELADQSWWGHEYGIGKDTAGVIDRTPEFIAAIKAANSLGKAETMNLMKENHRARLTAIEEDMREQASGSQDGYLLEMATRIRAILNEAAAGRDLALQKAIAAT